MAASNYEVIDFSEHLGDDVADLNAPAFTFVGNQTSIKPFDIPRTPVGKAYLIIQVFDVQNFGHRIQINGTDLPGVDVVRTVANQWQDVTDVIPEGVLRVGSNTIQVLRASGGDNILVGSVVVHWKEQGWFGRFVGGFFRVGS